MNPFDHPTPRDDSTRSADHRPRPAWDDAEPAATSVPAGPPPAADAGPPSRTGRGRGMRAVLAACILSATLASVSTTALLSASRATTTASTAATPNAVVAGTGSAPADLADVVAVARQSVVTITANGMSTRGLSPFSVPTTGVGSGIIVTANGYILTNRHVVTGSASLSVELYDGRQLDATLVQESSDNDLALIKVDAEGLASATIGDSSAIEVGDTAVAIGSPLGTYTETVTKGIISALGRDLTVTDEETGRPTRLHDLIQTDAAINPGNSGGPLLDDTGKVVGISTAVAASAEGLGFAIPINAAADLIAVARNASS
jgi:serine protease Do